VIDELQTLKT